MRVFSRRFMQVRVLISKAITLALSALADQRVTRRILADRKAALSGNHREAGIKAARTRRLREAGRKAARTRKRRQAARKAAATRRLNAKAATIRAKPQAVRALSIQQPWAEMILRKKKPYELRSWSTNYRGPLVIHAATKLRVGKRLILASIQTS